MRLELLIGSNPHRKPWPPNRLLTHASSRQTRLVTQSTLPSLGDEPDQKSTTSRFSFGTEIISPRMSHGMPSA